jgi:hypothetical protein
MSASVLKKRQVKHIENRAAVGLISICNFFATPTRLAAGLGTKDYPRVLNASPRFGITAKLWFPRADLERSASVIKFSTIRSLAPVGSRYKKISANQAVLGLFFDVTGPGRSGIAEDRP